MIKIAIANQKGGVGKTSTAVNLADTLTHMGYSVLFIDMDPQANSTSTYGAVSEGEYTIVDVMKKDCTAKEAIQHLPMGDIIPGDIVLAQEKEVIKGRNAREMILVRALKPLEGEYDFAIMDTPPDLDIYMINALTAANGVIIPILAKTYAIDGFGRLLETINGVIEDLNEDLKVYGVLLNCYEAKTKKDREIRENLPEVGKEFGFSTFNTVIRKCQYIESVLDVTTNPKDPESTVPYKSLFEHYGHSNAAADYVELAKELIEVINNG